MMFGLLSRVCHCDPLFKTARVPYAYSGIIVRSVMPANSWYAADEAGGLADGERDK